VRHVANPEFGAVIFRRTCPQVTNAGGLWDESGKLYPLMGAVPRIADLQWIFPSGARVEFSHLQHESTKYNYQGSQIALLGFDELTHFTESQFFYLLSRNRSTCGIRPYVRGTTNPDALSWVKGFLAPWLDSRHPQPAASGELRWFIRDGGLIRWVPRGTPDAKSVTFVSASIWDNPALMTADPGYLANLKALSLVDRARLLDGDWEIVPGGNMFRSEWFEIRDQPPAELTRIVRFWDMAATKPKPGRTDPDWTVGVLMGLSRGNLCWVLDVQRMRDTPHAVEQLIKTTAAADRARWGSVETLQEQEPGSSGVIVSDHYSREVLPGYEFRPQRSTGPKEERAKPFSAYAEAGNVKLVAAHWNQDYLNRLAAFPNPEVHDDEADASSGAFARLYEQFELETSEETYESFWGDEE
jgi:predicted phage terminase large subunit-like protein